MFRKMNGCNAGEGERERNDTQVPGTVLSLHEGSHPDGEGFMN